MPIYTNKAPAINTAAQSSATSFAAPSMNGIKASLDWKSNVVNVTSPLELHYRGSKTYEEARVGRVFNQLPVNRHPAVVLIAKSVSDVIRGVQFANERNLKVAVRSGGHAWVVPSVRDNSILIELGSMRDMEYDPVSDTAIVNPAISGGELNPYLAQWGRFFPGGHCPTVGLGGFLVQGGQGWNCRGWKWGCEYVKAVDVVLPSGEVVHADANDHEDVYWAARGSGPGFFGVIVRYYLSTRPIPLALHHTTFIIPAKGNYHETMKWYFKICRELDSCIEIVNIAFAQGRIFPEEKFDDPLEVVMVIRATALHDDEDQAKKLLEPMLTCPTLDAAKVKIIAARTSLPEEYEQQIADNPTGRYFVNGTWFDGEDEDVVDTMEYAYGRMPTMDSWWLHFSQAPVRELPDMCFDMQTEHYGSGYFIAKTENKSQAEIETESQACIAWHKTFNAIIHAKKGGSGGAVGIYLGDADLEGHRGPMMSDRNYERFCKIRDARDPDRRFAGFMYKPEELSKLNRYDWQV